MASEPKSLTTQDTKISAQTKISVLLKIWFDGTGVEMVEKKVTLDPKATQLCLLQKPKRRKSPIKGETEQHHCRYMAHITHMQKVQEESKDRCVH